MKIYFSAPDLFATLKYNSWAELLTSDIAQHRLLVEGTVVSVSRWKNRVYVLVSRKA